MKAWGWWLLLATVGMQIVTLPLYTFHTPAAVAPNFVLLVLLYLALHDRSHAVLLAALLVGTLTEAASLDPWGAHTIGPFFAVWLMRASLVESWDDRLPQTLLVTLGVAAAVSVRLCVLWLASPEFETPSVTAWSLELFYNVALSLPLFALLDAFRGRFIRTSHRQLAGP